MPVTSATAPRRGYCSPRAARRGRQLAQLGLLGLLVLVPAGAAAAGSAEPTTAVADSLWRAPAPDQAPAPRPRRADAARLRELAAQREFSYVEAPAAAPSAWDLFWERVWQAVREWLAGRSYQGFWRWVFYALFVAAAVFIVLKLLQVDITGAFGRSARPVPLPYDTLDENIHAVDFQTRLAEAEAAGNYRLALRLGYRQLLKQLSDRHLIRWQPDKTNHAYLSELPAETLRAPFRDLTRQFEYVWYGELPLPAGLYQQARASQQAFQQTLGKQYVLS